MANLHDILIQRYLRGRSVTKTEFKDLLWKKAPSLNRVDTKTALAAFPAAPLGVSFVPGLTQEGIRSTGPLNQNAITWAKLTTSLLGRMSQMDQEAIIAKYGNMHSEIIDPRAIIPGLMFSYQYEAATVDIFDQNPMVICLNLYKDGLLGLNLHYLPYAERFALFEAMMPLAAPLPIEALSKLYITYGNLKNNRGRFAGYRACIKRYKFTEFRSRAIFISPIEWAVALSYPSALFMGATMQEVWMDSLTKM